MRTNLFSLSIMVCCLCAFVACENEQVIPVNENNLSTEKISSDRSDNNARKSADDLNSLTGSVTGNIGGRSFVGNFTVQQFTENAGVLYAQGHLTDVKITGKDHKYLEYILEQEMYAIPVTIDGMSTTAESFQIAATCNILNFNFNGIDTNILGLAVTIDPTMITLNANDDEVLGNLICTALETVNSIVDLVGILNQILGLLSL